MKTNVSRVSFVLAFAVLCFLCTSCESGAEGKNYTSFSRWGISFEYPKEWKEHPANRVEIMKESFAQALRGMGDGRDLKEFTCFFGPKNYTGLMVMKYTTPNKMMNPSEFIEERNQVYDDAKSAGDVTKVNYVKETTAFGLPAVEEDVERSNGERGRIYTIIDGTTVFSISFILDTKASWATLSPAIEHFVARGILVSSAGSAPYGED